jgi:hypothetical protein
LGGCGIRVVDATGHLLDVELHILEEVVLEVEATFLRSREKPGRRAM